MSQELHLDQHARRRGPLVAVIAATAALVSAYVFLDANLWIIGFLALFVVPAGLDLIRNPSAGLHLTQDSLSWYSGRRSVEVTLDEIENLRFDTRLDFSVRATVLLKTGRRIRLPFEATPPHQMFEDALNTHGIKTERHHFTLMQ